MHRGNQLFYRNVSQHRQTGVGVADQPRMVRPTPQRMRSEIRRIRFYQDRLRGDPGRHVLQVPSVLEGHVSGERDEASQVQCAAGRLVARAEAVEDNASGRPGLPEDAERVLVSVPVVDNQWEPCTVCNVRLRPEQLDLSILGAVVPVPVQPSLAHGYNPRVL